MPRRPRTPTADRHGGLSVVVHGARGMVAVGGPPSARAPTPTGRTTTPPGPAPAPAGLSPASAGLSPTPAGPTLRTRQVPVACGRAFALDGVVSGPVGQVGGGLDRNSLCMPRLFPQVGSVRRQFVVRRASTAAPRRAIRRAPPPRAVPMRRPPPVVGHPSSAGRPVVAAAPDGPFRAPSSGPAERSADGISQVSRGAHERVTNAVNPAATSVAKWSDPDARASGPCLY